MAKKVGISIFGEAKSKAGVKAKSAKDDKEVVYIDGLEAKLLELEFLKAQVKDLTAQEKAVNDEIKDISREKFIELYKENKENPNTFLIKDGEGCVMVIPTDAYKKIDGDRANELIEQYGEDIITVEENYYFNPKVLERNMAAVEKLIMDAKTISDDDKRNLLLPDIKYSITKGSIDKLSQYGNKMQTVIDDIQPTIALKNCGGKMEEGGMMGDDFIGNIYEEDYTHRTARAENILKFVVKNLEVQKELENYLAEISNKYFIDYGEQLEEDGYDLDILFNVSVFADTSIPQYVTSFTVPIDDDINFNIDNSIEEKFGDSVELVPYYYAKGGKVDGRSTRAKNTWNSGASWTRDRNQFNKSQDWEVPMNKRMAEGGGVELTPPMTFYVYDGDKLVFKTRSGNKASDYRVINGKHLSIVAEDSNGNKKKIFKNGGVAEGGGVERFDEISEYVKKIKENRKAKGLGEMTQEEHSDLISELQEKFNSKYAKGGVPRNVGRDWIFKSKQDWEQKYDRKREYKEYKKEGWFANWFKEGGEAKDLSQYTEEELYDLYGKAEGNWSNDNGAEYERIQAELDRRFLKSQGVYLPVSTADKYSNFQEMKNLFESNDRKGSDTFFDRVLKVDFNGKTYYSIGYNLQSRGRTYSLKEAQNALNYYKLNGYDAIIMESPIPTFQIIVLNDFEYWLSNPSFIVMTSPALSESEYRSHKFEHGGEAYKSNDIYPPFVNDNFDYGSDLTDEAMVKNNLVNGEISANTLKQIVGCELSYPYQIVGAIKLEKCFMRPYYKLS
jgi:hypothetical protein